MSELPPTATNARRVQRGWIYIEGTRQDDGSIASAPSGERTGAQLRFSPFEAMSERAITGITWGDILKASFQRLAFWRR